MEKNTKNQTWEIGIGMGLMIVITAIVTAIHALITSDWLEARAACYITVLGIVGVAILTGLIALVEAISRAKNGRTILVGLLIAVGTLISCFSNRFPELYILSTMIAIIILCIIADKFLSK